MNSANQTGLFVTCFAVIALLKPHLTLAIPPTVQTLVEMYHTSWTLRDGAPSSIEAIAQTSDGYLWLGTDSGLFRFDGKAFERYHPSSGEDLMVGTITSLMHTPDGGLWIGYSSKGASFLKNGHNTNFGDEDGLTAGAIVRFTRDQSGTIWAASTAALWRWDGSRWGKVGAETGYAAEFADNVFVDSRDTLWVSSGTELLYLKKGSQRFQVALAHTGKNCYFHEAPNGSLWFAMFETSQVRQLTDSSGQLVEHPTTYSYTANALLFDKQGFLWVATEAHGVYRLHAESALHSSELTESVQRFSAADGLTNDRVRDLLADREGSIWVVSAKGLDRFRPAALTQVALPNDWIRPAIAVDGPNSLLAVGKIVTSINEAGDQQLKGVLKQSTSAYRDPTGVIWIGEEDGLWRYTPDRLTRVALPESLDPIYHIVQTMTMDRSGGLWVSFLHTGFMYYAQGHWSQPSFPSASAHDSGLSSYTDSKGQVWFGLRHNRVELVRGTEQIRYGPKDGVNVEAVTVFYERAGQIWVGGTTGIQFQKDQRFVTLRFAGVPAIEGVSGIIQLPSGDLWINQASGLLWVTANEVQRALSDPTYPVRFRSYNFLDGLTDSANQIRPNPTLIQLDNGRIYVATASGVFWIDPKAATQTSAAKSNVFVKSVLVDGRLTRDTRQLQLPIHANSIEFNYTATSLLIPERVRFQYRLDGFDTHWQEAGTRRQAFYSGLSPGKYLFRVKACDSDGRWGNEEAQVGLAIPPSFIQSIPFKALCAGLALVLVALAYQWRLRLAMAQIHNRLYERLDEREKIARDLHDSFFQSIQGLLLRFNTATSLLEPDEPARIILDETLARSDNMMKEGRELLLDLRTGSQGPSSLSEAFAAAGSELNDPQVTQFKVTAHGELRDLHPVAFEEIYRLGREAIVNAFRHAQASAIEVFLTYEKNKLKVQVRDDGIGIEPTILNAGRLAEHWGLPGMRERAYKLGAQLDIASQAGVGTQIEVRIPASVAYKSEPLRHTSLWFMIKRGLKRARSSPQ